MIKNVLLVFFVGILSLTNISGMTTSNNPVKPPSKYFEDYSSDLYKKLNDKELSYEAFQTALKGFISLQSKNQLKNEQYLTIIDMSISANKNRFFLIDLDNKSIIHKSIVAHGRNSGGEFAKLFSNKIGSYKSSIGFYKTAETYNGKHGLSLRLDGLEYSNSNARKRAIVIHAANYVSDVFINKNGRLGRSLGCPSLPLKNYSEIIDNIKNGSVLFIYYPNQDYLQSSKLANGKIANYTNNISSI